MGSKIYAPLLQTHRLLLLLFDSQNPTHYDHYLELINLPEIVAIMGDMKTRTHGQADRFLRAGRILPASLPHHPPPGRDDHALWMVHLKPEDAASVTDHLSHGKTIHPGPFIGLISIGQRSAAMPPDMGWAILPPYWEHGYATEAGFCLLHYAIQELGLTNLVAIPLETNEASIRTAQKLGFGDGGRMRDLEGGERAVFVREGTTWKPEEGMVVDLRGSWVEEEEECKCARCEAEGKGK
ncbi:hypothetical protein EV356DRAFT_50609 [Viridothelium virens]|uniref:N-acetyltransferase domain-containing protein n=1 Tax=Viridothelium virens TaxID=1048519 RepID=A0A6A6HFN8_VIRVR|nr:hypothetical protein EV356DRAFT_50609 [Viridothelium virens]